MQSRLVFVDCQYMPSTKLDAISEGLQKDRLDVMALGMITECSEDSHVAGGIKNSVEVHQNINNQELLVSYMRVIYFD